MCARAISVLCFVSVIGGINLEIVLIYCRTVMYGTRVRSKPFPFANEIVHSRYVSFSFVVFCSYRVVEESLNAV